LNRDLIDEVLAETGRQEKRVRLLPARVVVYYVLALTLFYGEACEEVIRRLVGGLMFLRAWRSDWHVPSTSALCQARARLGEEPLRELFERVAAPMAAPGSATGWYQGLRVMAVDGVTIDVPDSRCNSGRFGHGGDGQAPFPQVKIVALAECGPRAVVAAAIGESGSAERELMARLIGDLDEGMLVLADRGFYGYRHWMATRESGAQLLWRTRANVDLPVLQALPDGSYRSSLMEPWKRNDIKHGVRRALPHDVHIPVRVIEYRITDRGPDTEVVRLVTSLLDHELAPAAELAELYHRRRQIEMAFDEIETHQIGSPRVLRSKTPELIRQEIWALLLTHYAIRHLMWEAADDIQTDLDAERLSFMRSLRLVRRHVGDQSGLSPLSPETQPGPGQS
jgi:hypothetical protein